MFRGLRWEEAMKDAQKWQAEQKHGDVAQDIASVLPSSIPTFKNGSNFYEGLLEANNKMLEEQAKYGDAVRIPTLKKGGSIKHTSPLAMKEEGLPNQALYNAVQQTGFGIKSYIKNV